MWLLFICFYLQLWPSCPACNTGTINTLWHCCIVTESGTLQITSIVISYGANTVYTLHNREHVSVVPSYRVYTLYQIMYTYNSELIVFTAINTVTLEFYTAGHLVQWGWLSTEIIPSFLYMLDCTLDIL